MIFVAGGKAMPKIFRVSIDFTEKFKVSQLVKNFICSQKFWFLGRSTKVQY